MTESEPPPKVIGLPADGPDLDDIAKAWWCGHCGHGPGQVEIDQHGQETIFVPHSRACPVARGAVSDEHDMKRAYDQAAQDGAPT